MMKRSLSFLALMLLTASWIAAAPARPGSFRYRQPDGTVLVLERHGDEYCHWTTDAAGRIVEQGADGFYRPAAEKKRSKLLAEQAQTRHRAWSTYETAPATNFGERNILCLLVEFTDSTFVTPDPKTRFSRMLNESGYSGNGATGSVRDYYVETSHGQFRPVFDIYGPVQLSQPSASYGQTDNGSKALHEACVLLDDEIDFSRYDSDGDGSIDMVLFYYAGHNEAEGAGEESIWPHQSTSYGTFDGVKLTKYFCTSELRGYRGTEMCGIGTTCHEFAHSLGLPDFYDTDYENSDGENFTVGPFMLMSMGNYLNEGRTPPHFSAIELNMLGWMPNPEVLGSAGEQSLKPVREYEAFRMDTTNPGEYFILEYRDNTGWDAYLPEHGLLVYHIDASQNIITGTLTAEYLWRNTNTFNRYYGHPCCYLVPSFGAGSSAHFAFPGKSGVSTLTLTAWDGSMNDCTLSHITEQASCLSFTTLVPAGNAIWGTVTDVLGQPLKGALVRLSPAVRPEPSGFAAPSWLSTDQITYTDDNGTYLLEPGDDWASASILTVSASGYRSQGAVLQTDLRNNVDITLLRPSEGVPFGELAYDDSYPKYNFGYGSATQRAIVYRLTEAQIAQRDLSGSRILRLHLPAANTKDAFETAWIVAYSGTKQIYCEEVTDRFVPGSANALTLSGELLIPAQGDFSVGYAFDGLVSGSYPFLVSGTYDEEVSGYATPFGKGVDATWRPIKSGSYYFNPVLSLEIASAYTAGPADFGISAFAVPEGTLRAGDSWLPQLQTAADKPVSAVVWYLDGVAVAAEPQTLSAGAHTWKVEITFRDGTVETLWYDFDVAD